MSSRAIVENIAGWDIKCPCCNATGNAIVNYDMMRQVRTVEVRLHREKRSFQVDQVTYHSRHTYERELRDLARKTCEELAAYCDREPANPTEHLRRECLKLQAALSMSTAQCEHLARVARRQMELHDAQIAELRLVLDARNAEIAELTAKRPVTNRFGPQPRKLVA